MRMFARFAPSMVKGMSAQGGVLLPTVIDVADIQVSPTNADATLTLHADGDLTPGGRWHASGGSAYEARATVVSGSLSAGTTGSWLALSSDRSWSRTRVSDTPGSDPCTITLEIRRASDSVVLATSTVTLTAEVT